MGLYLKKVFPGAALGIWEITETLEEIYSMIQLSEDEYNIFSCLKSTSRKRQWLSYRLILPHLVKPKDLSSINYDKFGKPFLKNGIKHISVSHSGKFATLIASTKHLVGVDIEQIHPKITSLAHKFINDYELGNISGKHELESLYLIWTGKEAIYKLYGKRDILIKDHINICPFDFNGQGTIIGEINTNKTKKQFYINYQTIENYLLTYIIDNDKLYHEEKKLDDISFINY